MTTEIRVPQLPESVADATLVAWHKQPGDPVSRDENLADLETDKVVLEVPAPANGVVRELKVQSGTTVTSGQVLALIEEGGAAARGAASAPSASASANAVPPAPVSAAKAAPAARTVRALSPEAAPEAAPGVAKDGDRLSPAVRRLVEENRLDATAIPASGRDGRLTKSDVVDFLAKRQSGPAAAAAETAAAAPAPAAASGSVTATSAPAAAPGSVTATSAPAAAPAAVAPAGAAPAARSGSPAQAPAARSARSPGSAGSRSEQRIPMTRLRQRVAQRLVEAQSTQALLTSFNEVDLTAVQELRARYKDRFEKENGVKLGFMSFFVKACIEALKRFPVVNASVDGHDIVYHEFYDIGVAVSTERGLMVPIVRDADIKGFGAIEAEIAQYAKKAREGSIALEDLTGGTFTITNGGVFGSLLSTPIVNSPQSAILGMHKIQERPLVVKDASGTAQIAIRPMMYLAVTYDHRIIDGREAVQFLVTVKDCLEDPGRMLLGI